MWRYIKWGFSITVLLVVGLFLHYTLPQHDVVRIVNTYQERQDLGDWTRIFWSTPDDQASGLMNRDVQFIQAIGADGKPMVYRNEDTGWSWPPYFKFDTANLQTEADDLKSTAETPRWAMVTHYGWRNLYFSTFPNAISIRPVDDPTATIIPWFNIVFFVILAIILLMLRRMWLQFRERMLDPVAQDVAEAWDGVEDRGEAAAQKARGFWGRMKAWFGTFKGRPRR